MKDPIIAVSSWALHRTLGSPPFRGVEDGLTDTIELRHALLKLPSQIAAHGIHMMELCHFHLPSRDEAFLHQLRAALDHAGVKLHALLVDDGDLTSAKNGHRDLEWIFDWLPVAEQLGAQKVRVIGGKTTCDTAVSISAMMLRLLSRYASAHNLRLTTENWFPVLSSPAALRQLLEATEGRVGLNHDFGNWGGVTKYDDLAAIAPYAESCHAKADFAADGSLMADDYARCLALPYSPEFYGPFTIVAGGPHDDWQGIETTRDFILQHFAGTS